MKKINKIVYSRDEPLTILQYLNKVSNKFNELVDYINENTDTNTINHIIPLEYLDVGEQLTSDEKLCINLLGTYEKEGVKYGIFQLDAKLKSNSIPRNLKLRAVNNEINLTSLIHNESIIALQGGIEYFTLSIDTSTQGYQLNLKITGTTGAITNNHIVFTTEF